MKKLILMLSVITLLTGCADHAASPAAAAEQTDSISQTASAAPSRDPDKPEFFAWGRYSTKKETMKLEWVDEEGADSYRIIIKSDNNRIVDEVTGVSEYSFPLKKGKLKKEMIFCVERISDGESDMSEDIVMHKTENSGLKSEEKDSDGDGLSDFDEVTGGSDRFNADTDGDGLPDKYELQVLGTDPLKRYSNTFHDIDDPDDLADLERDGLTNLEEYRYGTNPYDGDCDEDGFPDGYEIKHGMDPLSPDEIIPDKEVLTQIKDLTADEVRQTEISHYGVEIYDNEYGNVSEINGAFNDYQLDSALDALYLIYSVKTLFGIDDPSKLELRKSMVDHTTDHYTFGQVYHGVPVESGYIMVSQSKVNNYTNIKSNYFPESALAHINTVPTIKEDELLDIAKAGAERPPEKLYGVELLIMKDYDTYSENYDPTPYLAYHFTTDQQQGIIVDAHTGEIRSQGNTYIID